MTEAEGERCHIGIVNGGLDASEAGAVSEGETMSQWGKPSRCGEKSRLECLAVWWISLAAVAGVGCAPQRDGTPPAVAGAASRVGAVDTPAGPEGLRKVPLGLCEDYPEESRSLEGVQRDLEALERAGVRTLRVSLGWDAIEPERNRYDFAFWDDFVELAVGRHGLTLIPYVAYTPEWNSDAPPDERWKSPPREPAEFGELMALLAARYRGRIHSWELWNEPDNRDYWLGTAGDYAELARAGSEAIRKVDPEIDIVSGGLAGRVEFLAELFDEFDAARLFDVVNLHSYYETWNPDPLETIPRYVADVSDIVRRHGGEQAIWMAELGYGNFRQGSRVSDYTTAAFAHEHTLDFQAVALVRSLALLYSTPVSLIAWYELKDPPATDAMIGDVNNRHLGIMFNDYRPKPAFAAFSLMARLFGGGLRAQTHALELLDAGGAPHANERQLHAFATARGTLVVIGWLGKPAGARASGAGDAVDERRERVRLRLPGALAAAPTSFDARGTVLPPEPGVAAGARELELELRGSDVRIMELTLADTARGALAPQPRRTHLGG